VAFGTKTLRLDSGERIVIPAAVRTLIPSRIIEQCAAYCKQQEFEFLIFVKNA
jgi:DNA-binding transcriptional regulator/RsmH inhibitor MraZ